MDNKKNLNPHQKALAINIDKLVYGTIAEIGAGQETARWFFRVGGAASTIAKAISAYDMTFSDSIYGTSPRYVSRDRLEAMLNLEYQLVVDRLGEKRGAETHFFAFANTVTTRSYSHKQNGGGWIGIRFQTQPDGPPSQVYLHVRLLGRDGVQDQETVGLLGVNLIYNAMYFHDDAAGLLKSLLDDLSREQLEIDLVDFSGPAFDQVDNRLMALKLVQLDLCNSAMFLSDGSVIQAADALYKKAVLVERSRFRPPTNLTLDMLDCAQKAFCAEPEINPDDVMVLSEITLHNLSEDGDIEVEDFLQRIELLSKLGKNVMISNYGAFYRLAEHLFRYTNKPIGVVMGLPTLQEVFTEKYYDNLAGGILESFGRMFKNQLRFYVCPFIDPKSGEKSDIHSLQVASKIQHLYSYLLVNNYIKALDTVKKEYLAIFSHQVLQDIRDGNPAWEASVPPLIAQVIKEQNLFR